MEKYIGKVLDDRYILTEVIGVGGMAVVYKAFDKVVNRVVAVKVLKEEFMSDAQFRRRFSNESKAITMLSQNNIVDVYGVCLEGDMMYIVMEYIDGITLKEYIDKVKVLDWKEAAFYIKQILKAMSHAHERGIVHRDLKPHNIMLLRDSTIKVTDFGIAKLSKFDTQTITDKAIGSVHYISPEQASGDRTDEKTDIYSVGVMFYEMLTGTLPFVADSPVSVALMQVQAQPKLPREINPEIPEGVEEIVIKAMMKSPDMRYSSALQMFNDILKIEENPTATFGYLNLGTISDDNDMHEDFTVDNSPTQFVSLGGNSSSVRENDNYEDDNMSFADEEYEESKFKTLWLPIICGITAAVLVVGVIVAGIIYWPEIKGGITNSSQVVEKVTVQNYVGQDYETVVQENATGLVFQKENVLSDQPKGKIISQDPVANTEVDKGTIVTFKVSIGSETVQIPDVSNKYYQVAFTELYELGIEYKTTYIHSDKVKENYVVKTNPKAYTEIKANEKITVYISSGPEIVTVQVPDLENRTEKDAVQKLTELNLKADKQYEYHETVPEDCVISQSIAKGELVEEGDTIGIVISKGPKPEDETTPPTDSENPDDTTPPSGSDGNENTTPPTDSENPDDTTPPTGSDGTENTTPPTGSETPDNTNPPSDDKNSEGTENTPPSNNQNSGGTDNGEDKTGTTN